MSGVNACRIAAGVALLNPPRLLDDRPPKITGWQPTDGDTAPELGEDKPRMAIPPVERMANHPLAQLRNQLSSYSDSLNPVTSRRCMGAFKAPYHPGRLSGKYLRRRDMLIGLQ